MSDDPRTVSERWFQRRPGIALLVFNLATLLVLAGAAEALLRLVIPYNPGFYSAVSGTSRELVYPYGVVKINSDGFPDDDFDLSKPRRIGYFGDSVTYGVGAGYGYRFSEIIESAYPELEHMNFGGIGLSISEGEIEYLSGLAGTYSLETALYFFNLNDILPDAAARGEAHTTTSLLRDKVLYRLDWLRGRSYLYTYMRTQVKLLLEARGIGFHGYTAYELYPHRYLQALEQTAHRIRKFHKALAETGVELKIVLLPYEMQISIEAEETYAEAGIDWGSEFIDRGPQRILLELLDGIPVLDAYFAFVDPAQVAESRGNNQIGEFFVYNEGDKLDWNHPNREGHRRIAELVIATCMLDCALATQRQPGESSESLVE